MLWLIPKMPPCLAGSLRRESNELSDGIIIASPQTISSSAANSSHLLFIVTAAINTLNPKISSDAPIAAMTTSGTRPASRRTMKPCVIASVAPMKANVFSTSRGLKANGLPSTAPRFRSNASVVSNVANASTQMNMVTSSGPTEGVRSASCSAR